MKTAVVRASDEPLVTEDRVRVGYTDINARIVFDLGTGR